MSDIRFNRWLHNSGTGGVYQDSSGRVGIGSSVPTSSLDIAGAVKATDFYFSNSSVFNYVTNSGANLIINGDDNILFRTDNTVERVRINASGDLTVTNANPGATTAGTKIAAVGGDIRTYTGSTATQGTIQVFGGASGTNVDATTSRGSTLLLVNTNTTDSNANAIEFHNSNSLSSSYISGVNVSHSSRTGSIVFGTANGSSPTEKMRLDNIGRILVGTTGAFDTEAVSQNYRFGIERLGGYSALSIKTNTADANGAYVTLGKSRGTSANSKTSVNSGDDIGAIYWDAADGTNMKYVGQILMAVDGSPSTGIVPSRLVFSTMNSSGTVGERARIDSSGRLMIGSVNATSGLSVLTYGTQLGYGGNTYPFPAGRNYIQFGNVSNGTDNWVGFTGDYGNSSGSCNIMLQATFNNINQQSGTYIGAEATGVAANALTFGHLTAPSTIGGNSTKVERMRINSSGNIGIGTNNPGNKLEVYNGGVILKSQSNTDGLIFQSPRPTTLASVLSSGGRGMIESTIPAVPTATTTNIAQTHWGGIVLVGYSGASYQGYQLVSFGYNGTPSVLHTVNWIGSLTTTYTTSSYTLRVSHTAGANIDFWVILIGV